MEKKLYCVRVTMYVMAENASGACVAATKAPFDIFECHARKADHVDAEWQNAIPYNADDERNCGEILEREKANHSFAASQAGNVRPRSLLRTSLSGAARPSLR
jgi:hypothetical protein